MPKEKGENQEQSTTTDNPVLGSQQPNVVPTLNDYGKVMLGLGLAAGFLSSKKDQANLASQNKATKSAIDNQYEKLCHEDFHILPRHKPSCTPREVYFRIKKIEDKKWNKDPTKKLAELNEQLKFFAKYKPISSWSLYYIALINFELRNFDVCFDFLKRAADLNDGSHHSLLAAQTTGELYFYAGMEISTQGDTISIKEIDPNHEDFAEACKNIDQARHYFRYAADHGLVSAKTHYAKTLLVSNLKSPYPAMQYLSEAADMGDAEAAYIMGRIYQRGLGADNPKVRSAKAMQTLQNNHIPDGFVLYEGNVQPLWDSDLVEKYLKQAADKKHPEALAELGVAYRDGSIRNINADAALAEKHLLEAIELGSEFAREELIESYKNGKGVIQADSKKLEAFLDKTLQKEYSNYHMRLFVNVVNRNQIQKASQMATFHIPIINQNVYVNPLAIVSYFLLEFKNTIKYRNHCLTLMGLKKTPQEKNTEELDIKKPNHFFRK